MPTISQDKITLRKGDDFHLHLRDGGAMQSVLPHTARSFARALVMPNLKPPITTVAEAEAYQKRILNALPERSVFCPLMSLYLTEKTTGDEIRRAKQSDSVHAVKLYPAGATTNSESGVRTLEALYPIFETMQEVDLPLLIHGEVVDRDVDIFDREKVFLDVGLLPLTKEFPELRIVLEHITTKNAVEFIEAAHPRVAATVTAHHLLLNRNALFEGGVRPHHFCLPILKRERDRESLVRAVTSKNPKFFAGTDSAPHAQHAKESACGCAGIYTAFGALELYCEVFDEAHALGALEAFTSEFGARFYGLPLNEEKISLVKKENPIPISYRMGDDFVVPLRAGGHLKWRLEERD